MSHHLVASGDEARPDADLPGSSECGPARAAPAARAAVDAVDQCLPQTQCTRCGFPNCRRYAEAVVAGETDINRCPPGGDYTIAQLARATGRPALALDPAVGVHTARRVAVIDPAWCIGCMLCVQSCPVDAIIGAPKRMHTVIETHCTGCELCLAPCPVDCIEMQAPLSGPAEPQAWQAERAGLARERFKRRTARLAREQVLRNRRQRLPELAERRAMVAEAIARVKAKRAKRQVLVSLT